MSRNDQQSLLGQRPASGGAVPTIVRNGAENERSPFLAEPVRLTPAWEANNLPNDELNFKGMTMERAGMEISPPYDRWKIIFFIFVLHGLGTLMPWNMFITAKSYFVDFKMNDTHTADTEFSYGTNFLAYVGFAAQIPNVFFNWINIIMPMAGSLTTRIVWSIIVEVIIFVITVILAMTDSTSWTETFFWVTMISVVILNVANGIYQNSVYGMAAKLPPKYTGAVVFGSNVSGTFTTVISILTDAFSSSPRTAAIYYFITALLILLICFDTYFALPLNKFYRYHEMLNEKEAEKYKTANSKTTFSTYLTILKGASLQLFNVFFVFFVTLAIFPGMHSDIKISDKNFIVPEKYYAPITCFLTFNVFAMLGSLVTSWIRWPKPKYLVIPVVMRVLFIPFFLFCNYHPKNISRILPIYIQNDWLYWSVAMLMGFTSGYLSSLGMMYTPRQVQPQYASIAGMFAAAMLITGIFSGILFSLVFPIIVKSVSW